MEDPQTRKEYIQAAKKMMNMTPASARRWQRTPAYQEYRMYRDGQRYQGYTDDVVERAISVYRGRASKADAQKVYQYLSRTKGAEAGEREYGKGSTSVSAETAAQRNWLRDKTGRFA
mgnify:CR=1 FL=1